jgi:signal peptidase II
MQSKKSTAWIYWSLAILLITIDQASKIYVKTHFFLGEEVIVFPNWFRIAFTENPGVAFGLEWGGVAGKYILSVFRIVFSTAIGIMLYKSIKRREHAGLLIAGVLIFAGAVGNVLDGIFYGQLFSASSYHLLNVASLVPFGQGYAPFLQGKVVDMFYFPIFDIVLPNGQPFSFFNAIFNVADSCISVGLLVFLYFLRKLEK